MAELSGEKVTNRIGIHHPQRPRGAVQYGVAEKDFQDWHDHLIKTVGEFST